MSGITLGGERAWKVLADGDLVVAYHWFNDEPTMFIYPRYRRMMLNKAIPWGLPLSAAHELVNADTHGHGVNTDELLAKASRCAEKIGYGDDRQAIFKIADLILAGLDDLVRMPPTPQQFLKDEQPAVGTLQIKEGGKIIAEREV